MISTSRVSLLLLLAFACDEPPSKTKTTPAPSAAAEEPAAPKPKGPPELEIDTISVKVGFERALLQHPEGRQKLRDLLNSEKSFLEGKELRIKVDRKAPIDWVAQYLEALAPLGPASIRLATETRPEFPQELRFTPESRVNAPTCSIVAMVTEDRGTAVWRLSGGAAGKRGKGMAGPDLSMTGETIERLAKGCPDSKAFFVSVAPGIEWGLLFDLAASARVLEKAKFEETVLLGEPPTPGHKITLKR